MLERYFHETGRVRSLPSIMPLPCGRMTEIEAKMIEGIAESGEAKLTITGSLIGLITTALRMIAAGAPSQ